VCTQVGPFASSIENAAESYSPPKTTYATCAAPRAARDAGDRLLRAEYWNATAILRGADAQRILHAPWAGASRASTIILPTRVIP
jgi:hypothetical protein